MRAILFFANGTEEIEAVTSIDILRRANIEVITVGIGTNMPRGAHGIRIETDTVSDKADINMPFDMIILPGGMPGTTNIENDAYAEKFIERAYKEGKYIAAICAAPSIIGKKGYLENKNAVCFPGFEKYLKNAKISDESVVFDGKFITAENAYCANIFALKCVEALCGKDFAAKLEKSVNAR